MGNAAAAGETEGDNTGVLKSLHPHLPCAICGLGMCPWGHQSPKMTVTCPHASVCLISGARVSEKRALVTQRKEAGQVGPELHASVFRVPLKFLYAGIKFLKRKRGTTGKKEELNKKGGLNC